jgi:hypothetical protein
MNGVNDYFPMVALRPVPAVRVARLQPLDLIAGSTRLKIYTAHAFRFSCLIPISTITHIGPNGHCRGFRRASN